MASMTAKTVRVTGTHAEQAYWGLLAATDIPEIPNVIRRSAQQRIKMHAFSESYHTTIIFLNTGALPRAIVFSYL
jgi:hypothetical protein